MVFLIDLSRGLSRCGGCDHSSRGKELRRSPTNFPLLHTLLSSFFTVPTLKFSSAAVTSKDSVQAHRHPLLFPSLRNAGASGLGWVCMHIAQPEQWINYKVIIRADGPPRGRNCKSSLSFLAVESSLKHADAYLIGKRALRFIAQGLFERLYDFRLNAGLRRETKSLKIMGFGAQFKIN